MRRLGVLAVICGDGQVRIVPVPYPGEVLVPEGTRGGQGTRLSTHCDHTAYVCTTLHRAYGSQGCEAGDGGSAACAGDILEQCLVLRLVQGRRMRAGGHRQRRGCVSSGVPSMANSLTDPFPPSRLLPLSAGTITVYDLEHIEST